MGRSLKIPDCKCVACERFRADGFDLWHGLERVFRNSSKRRPDLEAALKADLVKGLGCDLCGRTEARRAPFVPQVIKDFFRIEYLCEWCRNRIQYQRRALKWPVCWGTTPDDELKWFLLHDALEQFNIQVQKLSPAWQAKERAHREWLASLPVEEAAPDIEITLKRRVRAREIQPDATQ